ncbi:carboxylic ester hydrolase (plasmid) [Mycolicibacterium madagascariense]|uniref:Carboxylic ester hydrolase n=1 Tax=Mycolicibacterium madagascariense TaxID=212765 RepID=A0A7I7XPS7_9MYCO|nr:carboxylesterase family protein [Mycolicibacterium madagascariense]BBZ31239.1 carboxylic ester hydrolase [Mycolicibacterium madagascariense]
MDVVEVAQGRIRGACVDGVWSFKGIPYAAPPVGPLRFARPHPAPTHVGVLEATTYGPTVAAPPQRSPALAGLIADSSRPGGDALNLNVWTSAPGGSQLPVLVWIHGGGFLTGSGSTTAFDGSGFARNGVIVVTINYRLGVEGFLWLDGAVPNRGLLDQVAALTWVKENIAAFGGDPESITVAGESAGAMSVLTLATMPAAKGLFRRAIAQSGDGHHVHSVGDAQLMTLELSARLGVPPTPRGIEGVNLADLHRVTNDVVTRVTSGTEPRFRAFRRLAFQPVVDGEILTAHPVTAARAGATNGMELLIGTNADEYGLFTAPTGLGDRMTADMLRSSVDRLVDDDPLGLIARYRAEMPTASAAQLFVAIQSDWFCRVPTVLYADARRDAGADCFMYEFTWRPTTFGGHLGACHTLEIPFVFDTLKDPWGGALRGRDAPQELADQMHTAWTSFVTRGHPGWEPYGAARRVRQFDLPGAVVTDPHPWRRAAWEGRI